MACKVTYYGNDLQPSKLYNELVNRFGVARGEFMYLSSKLPQFTTDNMNDQGEPSIQAVVDADFKFTPKNKTQALGVIVFDLMQFEVGMRGGGVGQTISTGTVSYHVI